MSNQRCVRIVCLLCVVVAARLSCAQTAREVFPFVRGTQWTYAATVKFTYETNRIGAQHLEWTCTILEAFDHDDISAALLKGDVGDLAWWEPGRKPSEHVVLRVGRKYYLVGDGDRGLFQRIRRSGRKGLPDNLAERIWFEWPMKQGAVFHDIGDDGNGTMYGWWVEEVTKLDLGAVTGLSPEKQLVYKLVYRTIPSDEFLWFVPGVGIVQSQYEHHGTVSEYYARLVAFRRGE